MACLVTVLVLLVLLVSPRTALAGDLTAGFLDLLQPGLPRDTEFGGDPFAAPVGDQRGWWRRGTVGTGRGLRWQWSEHQPITRRLTTGDGQARYRELELALGYRVGWLRGVLQATHQDLHASIDPAPDRYALGGNGRQLALGLRAVTDDGRWSLQGTAPLAHSSGTVRDAPLGAGLRYRIPDRLAIEASWVQSPLDYDVDLAIVDQSITAGLNLDRAQVALAWDWRLGAGVSFAGRAAHTDLSPLDPVTDTYRYELQPTGRSEALLGVATIRPADRWTVALRGTYDELDLEGEGYWGGQRFATLSYVWGDVLSCLAAARYRTSPTLSVVADVQVSRLRGDGRLSVRSWPFTDAVIDLLGITSVGKAWVEVDWQRYHVAIQDRGEAHRLEAGFAWFNLFPDVSLREVHSGPFGIGAEITWHHLAADHVQLGAVILGGEFAAGRWRLGFDLYQFVAADAHENRPAAGEPGPAPPPGEPGDEASGWYGGTYARVRVGVGF